MSRTVILATATIVVTVTVIVLWGTVDDRRTNESRDKEDAPRIDSRDAADQRSIDSQEFEVPSEYAVDSASAVNPAFKQVSDEIVARVAFRVNELFFRDGIPKSYKRHRILEIDTRAFRDQLIRSYESRNGEGEQELVEIPLFDDRTVAVLINGWMDSELGVVSAFGQIVAADSPTAQFRVHLSDAGRIDASFIESSNATTISDVGDFTYYVVFEQVPFQKTD